MQESIQYLMVSFKKNEPLKSWGQFLDRVPWGPHCAVCIGTVQTWCPVERDHTTKYEPQQNITVNTRRGVLIEMDRWVRNKQCTELV